MSNGRKTPEGRHRCAEAKTIHGNKTLKARSDQAEVHGARMLGKNPTDEYKQQLF